jgi:hypothetical protein
MNGQDVDLSDSAAEVKDTTSNGNDGDAKNGAKPAIGKLGQGFGFDGTDDYVQASVPSNSLGIGGTRSVTVSGWLYLNQKDGNYRTAFNFGDGSGSPDLMLRKDSSDNYAIFLNNQSGKHETNTSFPAGEWTHMTFTYDGSKLILYADGSQIYSSFESGDIHAPKELIHIGQWKNSSSQNWDGKIDSIRIYNRALSKQEVKQLYRLGQ